jgi:hypothetical protein
MRALRTLADFERELRAVGFFEGGADGLVADVYLGNGLSRSLRRTAAPDPPEPCPLPPAAVGIRHVDEPSPDAGPFQIGEWERTWDESSYATAVEAVRDAIAAGDVYQVNLVQHLSAPFRGDPAGLAAALAPLDRWSRVRLRATAGRGCRPRPSSSSADEAGAFGRSRSRGRGLSASMGAVGRVYTNGDLDLALTIRTFAVAEGRIRR